MIRNLIRIIRRQPKATRDKLALGIAGAFTAVVFSVWIYNMPARMSMVSGQDQDESPGFSQIFKEMGDQLSSVKEAFPEKEVAVDTRSSTSTQNTSSSSIVSEQNLATSTQSTNNATEDKTEGPPVRTIRVVATSSPVSDY